MKCVVVYGIVVGIFNVYAYKIIAYVATSLDVVVVGASTGIIEPNSIAPIIAISGYCEAAAVKGYVILTIEGDTGLTCVCSIIRACVACYRCVEPYCVAWGGRGYLGVAVIAGVAVYCYTELAGVEACLVAALYAGCVPGVVAC